MQLRLLYYKQMRSAFIRWPSFKVATLNSLHMLNDGLEASLLLLLPFIAKDVGITLTQVGILGALLNVFAIIVALQTGRITMSVGGLKALVIALFVYSLGFAGVAAADNFMWLVAMFALAGLGFGLFHPVAFSLVAAWSSKETRGSAMGRFTAIGEIGKVALPALLTLVVVHVGWRTHGFVYAGLGLAVAVGLYAFLHFRKNINTAALPKAVPSVHWRAACNPRFICAAATTFLDSVASASLFVFLPFLLLKRGIDPALLGSLVALFFLGSFAGKLYIGKLIDKLGSARVFIVTDLLMAVFILLLTQATQLPVIITLAVLLGIFTKGTPPILQTMVSESAEAHGNFEKAFGLNAFISGFAITLTPLVLGLVSETWGVAWAFYCMAAAALLAIIPAWGFHIAKARGGSTADS
jgi:MFS transporter, FSR family, fosmidomycin resistance protein